MTLSIVGMEISYRSCSSLKSLERTLYSQNPVQEKEPLNPEEVVAGAIGDAALDGDFQYGMIINDHPRNRDLSPKGIPEITPIGVVESDPGSIFQSINFADGWIQENPNRIVLLINTTETGSGSILLTHPSRKIPAYALIETSLGKQTGNGRLDSTQLISGPSNVEYVEFLQSIQGISQGEFHELFNLLPIKDQEIALGSIFSQIPDKSGLAALIHASIIINRRTFPFSAEQLGDDFAKALNQTPFFLDHKNRPWLSQGEGHQRSALVVNPGISTEKWETLLLVEPEQSKILPSVRPTLKGIEPILVPIIGKSQADLLEQLQTFEADLLDSTALQNLANNAYAKTVSRQDPHHVCSLIGSTREDFQKELTHAKTGIPKAMLSQKPWTSPKGSYFTSNPLGDQGLAFVYPGAFNSYPGMARDLFGYFPALHDLVRKTTQNISQSLAADFLYPKNVAFKNNSQQDTHAQDFYNHPVELIESGISLSVLHTIILKDIFGVSPDTAFGYSLGESSMLWANGVWQNGEESSAKWRSSALYKTQLFGPMDSVRSYWNEDQLEEEFWGSYILKAPLEAVKSFLVDEPQVFLTIINTSEEVVIAGKRTACQRVISKLACHALPMPFNTAIHNPAVHSSYPDFIELYTHEVQEESQIQFLSAAEYDQLPITKDALARSMAKMTCNPVDFPRLVEKAYQNGARLFIEVGPQKTCSRWIEKILKSQPHGVIPINKKQQPDYDGVLKVVSMLLSHHVPLNLTHLYPEVLKESQVYHRRNGSRSTQVESGMGLKDTVPRIQETRHSQVSVPPNKPIPVALETMVLENLTKLSTDLTQSHQAFLQNQQIINRNIGKILQLQLGNQDPQTTLDKKPEPLFSTEQIIAFTTGDHQICFGLTFAEFGDRRIPRLPNGELRFIDRVMEIQGQPQEVINGSSLISEFDLPTKDWYLQNEGSPLPHVAIMESALQPCGFLSAYMGSIKNKGDLDLYFRNLDGEGSLLMWPDLIGETITNRVELLSSSTLQNVIIQEYAFELSVKEILFYSGTSSFGYFSKPMLEKQAGLNTDPKSTPWQYSNQDSGRWTESENTPLVAQSAEEPHLPNINQAWFSPRGGVHKKGYLYFKQTIPPSSWFYRAHFYQDPVMPGSLGVETMSQALIKYAAFWDIPEDQQWRIKPDQKTSWKYRGQIIRAVDQIEIELHIKSITAGDQGWEILADGDLWNGEVRIYHISDLALESY